MLVPSDPPIAVRVLIADDDAFNRRLLTEICTSEGYQVEAVETGRAAVERVASGGIHLLLLDASMPELSGYEVLEILRADPATRALPVIMVTANPQDEARERAEEIGVFSYVEKPFRIFDLTQRIRLALRRPRPDSAPPTMPRLRARRELGDVLPHLPAPHQLRPHLRRALDGISLPRGVAGARPAAAGLFVLRLENGADILRTLGRTARDGALGAIIVHLTGLTLGGVHRGDDDEIVWISGDIDTGRIHALADRLRVVASDTLDGTIADVCLGVLAVPPESAAIDVDSLLRAGRTLASQARASRAGVAVGSFVPPTSEVLDPAATGYDRPR